MVKAVGRLLARKGFKALGVNAVAREAGVDKVLIYRYFDGLPGLMKAFGQDSDFWPSAGELAGEAPEHFRTLPLADRMSALARNYLDAIRKRPVTQEIMAWELIERNQLTVDLEDLREHRMVQFFQEFMPEAIHHPDFLAISAIVGAAINYLVTRSRHTRFFSGVDLSQDSGWQSLLAAIDNLSNRMFR
ncbi:MAG: TetR/AcrR family transcriptional regulator [Desulfobacterales bacterium]|nr:TetR/AcrR family transcriptional regulator [Desulfobacterales bacterium]